MITNGCDSANPAWLKECADLEHEYDQYQCGKDDCSAAKTNWPYTDPVNNPPHYQFWKYEVIDVAEAMFATDPHLFQAFQYLARAKKKG